MQQKIRLIHYYAHNRQARLDQMIFNCFVLLVQYFQKL